MQMRRQTSPSPAAFCSRCSRREFPLTDARHLIGLLLGTEEDWPSAFEEILRRLGPVVGADGTRHPFDTERITIEPFGLRDRPRHHLVIDRPAYWYYHPREWLKKVALMDDVYLLNSPFTFQSMEKHAAYCAMLRLKLKVPDTVLVPYKNPVDNARYVYTAERYNRPFDLDAIAQRIGYPLFMKPYDGGAWRGVSRIASPAELHAAYDQSGEMLMHLQKAIDNYEVFARSLSIGAETMVMRFQPEQPMHLRYAIDHAKACPDVALTSLHYYFPWAIKALVKWCVFTLATGRRPSLDMETERYFQIADRGDLTYHEKLAAYRELADSYFETERYYDFCDSRLSHIDEIVADWVAGPDFDRLLIETVRSVYPAHEHDRFIAHLRGLLELWLGEESARPHTG